MCKVSDSIDNHVYREIYVPRILYFCSLNVLVIYIFNLLHCNLCCCILEALNSIKDNKNIVHLLQIYVVSLYELNYTGLYCTNVLVIYFSCNFRNK